MKLEYKKEQVLRLVPLGIDLDRAFIYSECTDEDIEKLKKDVLFNKELQIRQIMEEKHLLQEHRKALKKQTNKGITTGTQWKLAKINPEKWGADSNNKTKGDDLEKVKVYIPENGR